MIAKAGRLLPGRIPEFRAFVVDSDHGLEGALELTSLDGTHGIVQVPLHREQRGDRRGMQRQAAGRGPVAKIREGLMRLVCPARHAREAIPHLVPA